MIRIELINNRTGESEGTLLSSSIPQGVELILYRAAEDGGDPVREVWYIDGVLDVECRQGSIEGPFEIAQVNMAVTRSVFDKAARA